MDSSQLGFHNLPFLAHRKSVKKGFEFTLMVVGEPARAGGMRHQLCAVEANLQGRGDFGCVQTCNLL